MSKNSNYFIMNKIKTHCKHGHEYTEENVYIRSSDGRQFCRVCRQIQRAKSKEKFKDDPHHILMDEQYRRDWVARVPDRERMRMLLNRYKITEEIYDRMLLEQDNCCLICHSEFVPDMRKHVDHDHACCPGVDTCGKCIRGVLCSTCNRGLGNFKDNPEFLVRAAEYLRTSKKDA